MKQSTLTAAVLLASTQAHVQLIDIEEPKYNTSPDQLMSLRTPTDLSEDDFDQLEFKQWIQQHKKEYLNENEYFYRFGIFKQNRDSMIATLEEGFDAYEVDPVIMGLT